MTQDTPTVEDIVETFDFEDEIDGAGACGCAGKLASTIKGMVRTTLTTYGNARYDEGVRAERERCVDLTVKWFKQWLKDKPVVPVAHIDKVMEEYRQDVDRKFLASLTPITK